METNWAGISIDIHGYKLKKDPDTNWPGSFDWRVRCPRGFNMGWFGSRETAEAWIMKQRESGIMEEDKNGR